MTTKTPLRLEREQRGWSQARLAEMLGTSILSVSRWERGTVQPSPYFQERLIKLFKKDARMLGLLVKTQKAPSEHLKIIDPLLPSQALLYTGLIGREDLLQSLTTRLCTDPSPSTVALYGLPGVGKTTLLIALTGLPKIQQQFADGILWAGLGSKPQIFEHLARWGNLLRIPQEELKHLKTQADLARALRIHIGSRRLLLILDDIWQMQDAIALQIGGVNCTHLITTRFPSLATQFGQQHTIHVSELEVAESRKLLSYYLPYLTEQEPQTIEQLAQEVGMLPLALTLIGKHLSLHDYSRQHRRLHTRLEQLRDRSVRLRLSQPQSFVEHHPSIPAEQPLSLEAIITVSTQQLSQAAREALYYLALIPAKPNSFTEDLVTALTPNANEALDELVDAGLVEAYGTDRYTLHQTIIDYASTRALDQEKQAYFRIRLIEYATSWLDKHTEDYKLIEHEYTNLLTALAFAVDHPSPAMAISLVNSLMSFWIVRGWYLEAHQWLKLVFPLAQGQQDHMGEIGLLRCQGDLAKSQANYEQAKTLYQQSIDLAYQAQIPQESIFALRGLSWIEVHQGNYEQSEYYARQGTELAQQSRGQKYLGYMLNSLGLALNYQNRFKEAEHYFQEGLSIAQKYGQKELTINSYVHLGLLKWLQGLYNEAEMYDLQGLQIAQEIGHQDLLYILLSGLGSIYYQIGDYQKALQYCQQSVTQARQIGARSGIAISLHNLAEVFQKLEKWKQAKDTYDESLTIAYQIDLRMYFAANLCGLGEIALQQKPYDEARTFFEKAIQEAHTEVLEDKARALYGLAKMEAAQNHLEKALEYGRESLKLHEQIQYYKTDEIPKWVEHLERSLQKP